MDKIDFTTLILSISTAAFMGLGVSPPGSQEEVKVDLKLARHNIDLLELLLQKTKGNLSEEELKLLEQVLYETRIKYLEVQKTNS